jgi:ADP-heptose:LPS heptosyltransferase
MNLRLKLKIDHYVGGCLAWLLNLSARTVALFWKRDHTLRRTPRTVLFLKFSSLGSIARAAFLVKAVRDKWPACRIGFACFPGCAELARLYSPVDQVLVVRDTGVLTLGLDTLRLILWAWRKRVELVIDLEVHSKYSSVVTGLTPARDRSGFAGVTSRFRRGLYTHLVFWNPARRVDIAYRQLGRALGLDPRREWIQPTVPNSACEDVDALLAKLGVAANDRILGVNANASELSLERRWPAEYFSRVIEALPPHPRVQVLLLGSSKERPYVARVAAATKTSPHPVHNLAGRVLFLHFLALLRRLTLLLTNDSGPLHLAAALQVPSVSVWGPTHPAVYAPRGRIHRCFYRPIYCSPCVHFADVPPCGGDNQCLKQLDWRPVARAVSELLDMPQNELALDRPYVRSRTRGAEVLGYWRRESVSLPIVQKNNTIRRSDNRDGSP